MTFHKILCAVDFSPGSRRALEHACRLAIGHGAELVVLHAWQLPVYVGDYVPAPEIVQASVDDDKRLLDAEVAFARSLGTPRVTVRDVSGVAWRAVVELAAEDRDIDLIVVGTHGRTGIRRVLLGSVAEKIVRLAPVSTLAVHPDDKLGPFQRVLVPTDFSESSLYAGELAAQMLDARGAELELVHVVDLPRAVETSAHAVAIVEDLEAQADQQLERQATRLVAPGRVHWHAELGRVAEKVLARIDDPAPDLVVVGSHGRSGLARMVLGSVAELVVRHAHCPVLVARRRAPATN